MTYPDNRPSINDIRQRLRGTGDNASTSVPSQPVQPTQAQIRQVPQNIAANPYRGGTQEWSPDWVQPQDYQQSLNRKPSYSFDEGPGVIREKSTFRKISDYRPPEQLAQILKNAPIILGIMAFLLPFWMLYAPFGLVLPGTEGMQEQSHRLFVASLSGIFLGFFTHRFIRKMMDAADGLHAMRNINTTTTPFKIGAALGAGCFLYRHYNPPMVSHMIDPPTFQEMSQDLIGMPLIGLIGATYFGGKVLQLGYNQYFGVDEDIYGQEK